MGWARAEISISLSGRGGLGPKFQFLFRARTGRAEFIFLFIFFFFTSGRARPRLQACRHCRHLSAGPGQGLKNPTRADLYGKSRWFSVAVMYITPYNFIQICAQVKFQKIHALYCRQATFIKREKREWSCWFFSPFWMCTCIEGLWCLTNFLLLPQLWSARSHKEKSQISTTS